MLIKKRKMNVDIQSRYEADLVLTESKTAMVGAKANGRAKKKLSKITSISIVIGLPSNKGLRRNAMTIARLAITHKMKKNKDRIFVLSPSSIHRVEPHPVKKVTINHKIARTSNPVRTGVNKSIPSSAKTSIRISEIINDRRYPIMTNKNVATYTAIFSDPFIIFSPN